MTTYRFSVIVPIIYLTEFSSKAMLVLCEKAKSFPQISFILSCSETVEDELKSLIGQNGISTNLKIISSINDNSNNLRHNGLQYAESEYVYYQDCDDEVDYQVLLDNMVHCNGKNVVCFNIKRRQFDQLGNVKDERLLYSTIDFEVKNIDKLMTNIVNKLIPREYIEKIFFYNIPFSQDLSLSFQLFEMCPHFYCAECVYLYENNWKSTAGIKKTKRESLLRVVAIERILIKLLSNKKNKAFVKYRYEIVIHDRFAFLKECYWPSLSIRAINPFSFGFRGALKHLYHYLRMYFSCLRIFASSFLLHRIK